MVNIRYYKYQAHRAVYIGLALLVLVWLSACTGQALAPDTSSGPGSGESGGAGAITQTSIPPPTHTETGLPTVTPTPTPTSSPTSTLTPQPTATPTERPTPVPLDQLFVTVVELNRVAGGGEAFALPGEIVLPDDCSVDCVRKQWTLNEAPGYLDGLFWITLHIFPSTDAAEGQLAQGLSRLVDEQGFEHLVSSVPARSNPASWVAHLANNFVTHQTAQGPVVITAIFAFERPLNGSSQVAQIAQFIQDIGDFQAQKLSRGGWKE